MQIGQFLSLVEDMTTRLRLSLPVNITAPSISANVIGETAVLSFGIWENDDSITGRLLRNGQEVLGNVIDGQSYLLTAADDLSELSLEVTALKAGASGLVVPSAPVQVRYTPPVAGGALEAEIFDEGTGDQLIETALDFTGDGLQFSLEGEGATIDPDTGVVTIPTDTVVQDGEVTVIAQNSGGEARSVVRFVVEPVELIIYESHFDTDRSADFVLDQGNMQHVPQASNVEDPIDGAMRFGANGVSWQDAKLRIPVQPNTEHRVEAFTRKWGGRRTENFSISLRNANDAQLWIEGPGRAGVYDVNVPGHPDAVWIELKAVIPNSNTGDRFDFHRVRVTEVPGFAAMAAPILQETETQWWAEQLYVGVPSRPIDLSEWLPGPKTGFTYSGPEPVSFDGDIMTITPEAETTGGWENGTVERTIRADNNGELSEPVRLSIRVDAAPGPLVESSGRPMPDYTIEAGEGIPPIYWDVHCVGGARPFTHEVLEAPAWMTVEDSGIGWGETPETPGAHTFRVRVTDIRGDEIVLSSTINVTERRDRTPTHVLPDGGVLAAFLADNGIQQGAVIQAPSGGTWQLGALQNVGINGGSENPIIVVGDKTAILINRNKIEGVDGLILEGFRCEQRSSPINEGQSTSVARACIESYTSSRNIFIYDVDTVGFTENAGPGVRAMEWNQATFIRPDDYAYSGNGFVMGDQSVVSRCTADKVFEGYSAEGREVGFYRNETRRVRDDGIIVNRCEGTLFYYHRGADFDGNIVQGNHRDLIQPFANYKPVPRGQIYDNLFMSMRGSETPEYRGQGIHADADGWSLENSNFERTRHTSTQDHFVMRDSVILCDAALAAFLFERMFGTVENCILLPHPSVYTTDVGIIRMRRSSDMVFRNTLYNRFSRDNNQTGPVEFDNCEQLDRNGGVNLARQIFPNWDENTLQHEDPRDAVAAGLPPSAARFWIDPNSQWNLSNRNGLIGPQWLRTG